MTKGQRRNEQRIRAALRAAAIVASGPNEPEGARCPLPSVGAPAFRDGDVAFLWRSDVFARAHLIHRLRGAEKAPPEPLKHERRANLGG